MEPASIPPDDPVDDRVYFRYEQAADSFTGHLEHNEEFSMTEVQIKEFVQYSNHPLYQRLRGLPFNSFDIPLSYHAQRSFKRNSEMDNALFTIQHPQEAAQDRLCQSSGLPYVDTNSFVDHHRSGLLELQTKRQITASLIVCGKYFNGSQERLVRANDHGEDLTLDGVDHVSIVQAAERLYYDDHDSTYRSTSPELNLEHGTPVSIEENSKSRYEKRDDINNTLKELHKFEQSRRCSHESAQPTSPDLSIHRPAYMEAPKERYRKQGWRRWDKIVGLRKEGDIELPSPKISPTSQLSADSVDRFCYCLEPIREGEMIQCNNEWCSIGWFHFCCTDLAFKSSSDEPFVCEYCQDGCPFEYDYEDANMVEVTADNDRVLGIADQLGANDAELDDNDGYEADQDDLEGSPTLKSSLWGTPINLTTATAVRSSPGSPTPMTRYSREPIDRDLLTGPSSTTDNEPSTQMDGCAPLSPVAQSSLPPENSPTATFASSDSVSVPTAKLFPGSTFVKFADLAPFISAKDLPVQANTAFEEWKFSMPPSRLVQILASRGTPHLVNTVEEILEDTRYEEAPRLSAILTRVSS